MVENNVIAKAAYGVRVNAPESVTWVDGTVAWFRAEGTAASAATWTGALTATVGTVGYGAGVAGGQAFQLTRATPGYVRSETPFYTQSARTVTVEGWVNPATLPAEGEEFLIASNNSPDSPNYAAFLTTVGGTPRLAFRYLTYTTANVLQTAVSAALPIAAGSFRHVAVTADGTNVRFYLDGVLAHTAAVVGSPTYVSNVATGDPSITLYVGGGPGAANRTFDGRLDEVAVYSRALTAAELARIHGRGGADKGGNWTRNTTIRGNLIGLMPDGTTAGSITTAGVSVLESGTNTIGGPTAADRNVIASVAGPGVVLDGGFTTGTTVQGNYIGTDRTGTLARGNHGGVAIRGGASNNLLGGIAGTPGTGAGNVISANDAGPFAEDSGVFIHGAGTTGNRVQGNIVGLNAAGTARFTGQAYGVTLWSAGGNTVGGADAGAGNVISGNDNYGVAILASNNLVQGNTVGLARDGDTVVGGQAVAGVYTAPGHSGNQVRSNPISGNSSAGVYLRGGSNNTVAGNLIGTDKTGTLDRGNGGHGVYVTEGETNSTIGGTTEADRNVIGGNQASGVSVHSPAGQITITGNSIGTDRTGSLALGNGGTAGHGRGVLIADSSGNVVGGTAPGAGSTIAFNTSAGVAVTGAGSAGNRVRGNATYSNGGLGIDLGADGVTANDAADADAGPNGLANFPALEAVGVGPATRATGALNGSANTAFAIDFYAGSSADPTGYGEGRRYLGSVTVTTNASGSASFDTLLAAETAPDEKVTATATDAAGNTSEFSLVRAPSNAAPFFAATDLTLTGDANPALTVEQAHEAGVIRLQGSFTDPDRANVYSVVIDWGYGDTETITVGPEAIVNGDGLRRFTVSRPGEGGHTDEAGPSARLVLARTAEGRTVRLTGTFTDPDATDTHTVVIAWGDGASTVLPATAVTYDAASGLFAYASSHLYTDDPAGDDDYTVGVTVTDSKGVPASAATTLAVANLAPSAALVNGGPTLEGGSPVVSFAAVTDASAPDAAALSYRYDFDNDGTFDLTSTSASAAVPAAYLPDGRAPGAVTLTVRGRVSDDDGGYADYTTAIAVNNTAPTVAGLALGAPNYAEDDLVTLTGTVADPGVIDTHTVVVNWGDGSPVTALHVEPGARTFTLTHRYLDDPAGAGDRYTVTVAATDKDGASGSAAVQALVANAAPKAVIRSREGAAPGTIALRASEGDSGTLDTFTYSWAATPLTGTGPTVTGTGRGFDFAGAPYGVYLVTLTVTDDDGGQGTDSALVIGGTPDPDVITVTPAPDGKVAVLVGAPGAQHSLGQFHPGNRIIVLGQGENDVITVDAALTVPAELNGDGGNNSLTGGGGNDIVLGGDGNDTVVGRDGDDTLDGGKGDDRYYGGDGNDRYVVVPGSDNWLSEVGTGGTDTVDYSGANYGITFSLAVEGTMQVVDSARNGVQIDGAFENLTGSAYGDKLAGNSLDNTLFGGDAVETVAGAAGGDVLDGAAGNDSVVGGTGNDTILGGTGRDTITGGAGNDIIFGGDGVETVAGAAGDSVAGGSGNDTIAGGSGADTIAGGTGNGTLTGAAGNDIIFGDGTDTVVEAADADFVLTDSSLVGRDRDELRGVEKARLVGGTGANRLDARGFSGPAELIGGAGNDTLLGGSGTDTLNGGSGDDLLDGGAGDDEYAFAGDTLGTDTVTDKSGANALNLFGLAAPARVDLTSATAQTVAAGKLTLTLTDPAAVTRVIGTGFADTLVGNDAANLLVGGGGRDRVEGGAGNDVLQAGVTQVVYLDFVTHTDGTDHVYLPEERDAIQARMAADFAAFGYSFTQTRPAAGPFATVFFNKTPLIHGKPQPGGIADEIDWRNANLGGTVAVDVNRFMATGPGRSRRRPRTTSPCPPRSRPTSWGTWSGWCTRTPSGRSGPACTRRPTRPGSCPTTPARSERPRRRCT